MGAICSCFSDGGIAAEPLVTKPIAAVPIAATYSSASKMTPAAKSVVTIGADEYASELVNDKAEQHRRATVDAIFTLCDKNGDGKISRRELKDAIKAQGPDFAQRLGLGRHTKHNSSIGAWFDEADENHDGFVDRTEFQKSMATLAGVYK